MADLTPEQIAQGIFLDASGNPTLPDGSPAFGGVLGAMARAAGPQPDSQSSGPLFFQHGAGDLPATPEGMTQNVIEQFGAAPSGDLEKPFWSDVTPAGDTTGTQTIYRWNNASDPRVDAWYAEHGPGPEGPESLQQMQQMLHDIPDAGRGSSLGRVGTAHQQAINTFLAQGGDPAEASQQHARFYGGGEDNPSTDNWHLLPYPYNKPGYIMRNGIIIFTKGGSYAEGYPEGYHGRLNEAGQNIPITGVYSPHTGPKEGFPASYGMRGINYGWPGALWGWGGGNWDLG